jgi:glucose/arabinose dehydrogenase
MMPGRLFATQHGDQLFQNWPRFYTASQSADLPAEELVQLIAGADYGWPECYYDQEQKKLVLAPEYGGDGGKTVGVCAQRHALVAAFPGHWAPYDLAIYHGASLPAAYRGGAVIAFHGSWNRAPDPHPNVSSPSRLPTRMRASPGACSPATTSTTPVFRLAQPESKSK